MTTSDMTSLPDYAPLCQIRNALWGMGPIHGAAVMVGSGFSKFAFRAADTVPMPPSWQEFVQDMFVELYPNSDEHFTQEPLALAQEYQAALGPKALENLIRTKVRDSEWRPGELHHQLLQLPWKDVLTTNWDTLLEKSVEENPNLSYDIVRTTSDVARTTAPRIVKLHGILPSHTPFIFTEEDFRTYPNAYPAFVNLARQVLVENELCLLGFSGNDPNFLEWSGWVRDQLGSAARPVRLVGMLNLSLSRRRYFENRNVTVIDLAPMVRNLAPEDGHRRAAELFTEFMAEGKPQPASWKFSEHLKRSGSEGDILDASKIVETWEKDRCVYPGWLVAPIEYRLRIRSDVVSWFGTLTKVNGNTTPNENLERLIELVWRHQVCFASLPSTVEDQLYGVVSADGDETEAMENRVLLRKALVQAARQRLDFEGFSERVQLLEELDTGLAVAEASYERCLMARDFLDYETILGYINGVQGEDPIWKLRKAALLSEMGDVHKPVKLIYEAFRELRRRRAQSPDSIWILSREAWASWLLGGATYELSKMGIEHQREHAGSRYKEARAGPWDEIYWLARELVCMQKDRVEASRPRIPSFDPGSYVVPGRILYGAGRTFPDSEILWLSEVVGIPLRLGHTDLLASKFAEAALCSLHEDEFRLWWLVRTVASGELDIVREQFSRSSVARMPEATVEKLIDRIIPAVGILARRIEYIDEDEASHKSMNRATMATDFLEVLSFLSSRCNNERALQLIEFAASLSHSEEITLAKYFQHLSTLIARSVHAVEPDRRPDICLTVLKLPLARETKRDMKETVDWSAVLEALDRENWRCATRTSEWSGVIERLLRAISDNDCEISRLDAIHRLFEASEANLLTDEENRDFGNAIWTHVNEDGSPSSCNFYPHVFRLLPGAHDYNVDDIFHKAVVEELVSGKFTESNLAGLHGASFDREGKYSPMSLKAEDADKILENMLQWQPRPKLLDPFSRQEWEDREIAVLIGRCLSSTVLPSSTVFERGISAAKELLERVEEPGRSFLILAAMVVASRVSELRVEATRVLQKGLISQDPDTIGIALNTVLWLQEVENSVPEELVQDTLSICLMRREPGLLGALVCVRKFVEGEKLLQEETPRLIAALELLWTETEYSNWLDEARGADVGLLRQAVVKLCQALHETGVEDQFLAECIRNAGIDPMPEVRFVA